MRFYTTVWNVKRQAKRLKKVLKRLKYDVSYTACLDLISRLYGFSNFAELKRTSSDQPLSAFDDDVDGDLLEARFQYQERVMIEAGFSDVAGIVLDEVDPTSSRNDPIPPIESI